MIKLENTNVEISTDASNSLSELLSLNLNDLTSVSPFSV